MFLQIIVNNKPLQLGGQLPDAIKSCSIDCFPGVAVPSAQVQDIKSWLNMLVDHLDCEYVSYNGVLSSVSDVNKFTL